MPLVVFERDLPFRADDEVGIEPAIRKLRQFLANAAGDDVQAVLLRQRSQLFRFRAGNDHHLVHLILNLALAPARRPDALHEVFGQHHQAHRLFPEIAHAEVDQIANPIQVLADVFPFFHHGHFWLHDQRGVGGDSFGFFRHDAPR